MPDSMNDRIAQARAEQAAARAAAATREALRRRAEADTERRHDAQNQSNLRLVQQFAAWIRRNNIPAAEHSGRRALWPIGSRRWDSGQRGIESVSALFYTDAHGDLYRRDPAHGGGHGRLRRHKEGDLRYVYDVETTIARQVAQWDCPWP